MELGVLLYLFEHELNAYLFLYKNATSSAGAVHAIGDKTRNIGYFHPGRLIFSAGRWTIKQAHV